MSNENMPTSIQGVVVQDTTIGIAVQGTIFEADDPQSIGPSTGDVVIADLLPSSSQYLIRAIVP